MTAMEETLRHTSLSTLSGDTVEVEDVTVIELIDRVGASSANAVAIAGPSESITYAELVDRAARLASELRDGGAAPGAAVALTMERSPAAVVALLAILRTGAVAVLADRAAPAERLGYMLRDSCACLVVSDSGIAGTGDDWSRAVAPAPNSYRPSPGAAYVIYTSGSTGTPKGVEISHAALSHSTQARFSVYPHRAASFLHLSPLAFDSALAGIFWTLCQGGTLLLPSVLDPFVLDTLEASPSYTLCTPSFYETYLSDLADRGSPLPEAFPRNVIVAGEACTRTLLKKHRSLAPSVCLYNEYGPTEACVWATVADLGAEPGDRVPSIGRPIANTTILVCDPDGCPVALGEPGELCIVGPGVANGYVNQSDLTWERFCIAPLPGGPTMYRTGDIARIREDGKLEYLGRGDNQVKVRGLRIEIEEVEHQLGLVTGGKQAAVTVVEAPTGGQLVGFVVSARSAIDCDRLRRELGTRLPAFMVPARLETVDRLPTTWNGKLDRAALARYAADVWSNSVHSEAVDPTGRADDAPPTSEFDESSHEVTRAVAGIWQELLQTSDDVGPSSDFFALGGHSLLASRVIARVRREVGVRATVRDLFDFPTLAQFVARLTERTLVTSTS